MRGPITVMRCAWALLLGLAVVACQDSKPEKPQQSTAPQEQPVTEPVDASTSPAARSPEAFSVHEWGLLSFAPDGQTSLRTGCLHQPSEELGTGGLGLSGTGTGGGGGGGSAAGLGKPVIHFHPQQDFDWDQRIFLSVSVPGAILREVWPTPGGGAQPKHGEFFAWKDIELLDKSCLPTSAPSLTSAACQGLDGPLGCEASQLSQWLSEPLPCVRLEGIESPALLYNATASWRAPFSVEGDELLARSEWSYEHVWLRRSDELFYFEAFEPEARAKLDSGERQRFPAEGAFAELIRPQLLAAGLTKVESDAFLRAWEGMWLPSSNWQLLAMASPAAINAMLPMQIEPTPRSLVRVLFVAIEAPPGGAR